MPGCLSCGSSVVDDCKMCGECVEELPPMLPECRLESSKDSLRVKPCPPCKCACQPVCPPKKVKCKVPTIRDSLRVKVCPDPVPCLSCPEGCDCAQ